MSAYDPKRTFTLSEAAGVLVSPGTTATKRNNAVTSITMGLDNTEQEILAFEVADVALEIAAGTAKGKANFTIGACTGLYECPSLLAELHLIAFRRDRREAVFLFRAVRDANVRYCP